MEYIFYTLLLLHLWNIALNIWPLIWHKNKINGDDTATPISIIIAARNESQNLRKLIPELLTQLYDQFEIIVALDRCEDDSLYYLNNLKDNRLIIINIDQVPSDWNPKKYALHQAIAASSSEWLLFTDADCTPASIKWIQTYAHQITSNTDLILGIGAYNAEKNAVSQITDYETMMTAIYYMSAAKRGTAYMGVGRNMAYRKSAFEKVRGFESIKYITGGDDDLVVQKIAKKHNTTINTDKKSLTYSISKRTWSGYFHQKTRHLSVGKHYQPLPKIHHIIRSLIHGMLWVTFIYLLVMGEHVTNYILLFASIVLVKGILLWRVGKKINLTIPLASYPVLDLFYAIVLPLIGIRAQIVKNIQWKN